MRSSQIGTQTTVNVAGEPFVWDSNVNLDKVVVINPGPVDALSMAAGASGTIRRVEITTNSLDGIKVQNTGNVARDCRILSGYLRANGKLAGAHQDGIQVMGGTNLFFSDIIIDGFDTQGIILGKGGSGATTPTNVTFTRMQVGPAGATAVLFGTEQVGCSINDSDIWATLRFNRGLIGAPTGTNRLHPATAPFPLTSAPPPPPPPPSSTSTSGYFGA